MHFLSGCFHTMAYTCDLLPALWKFKSITEAVLYVNKQNAIFYQWRYEKKLKEYIDNGSI